MPAGFHGGHYRALSGVPGRLRHYGLLAGIHVGYYQAQRGSSRPSATGWEKGTRGTRAACRFLQPQVREGVLPATMRRRAGLRSDTGSDVRELDPQSADFARLTVTGAERGPSSRGGVVCAGWVLPQLRSGEVEEPARVPLRSRRSRFSHEETQSSFSSAELSS